ncbi:hypothetical protein EB001_14330 [bacterium]|nr:hypothetical protein [bacterium]
MSSQKDDDNVPKMTECHFQPLFTEKMKKAAPVLKKRVFGQTFTLTYCETAENHKGMQMIGDIADRGLTKAEIDIARAWFTSKGINTIMVCLNDFAPKDVATEPAYLLIAKNGISAIVDPGELYEEQNALEKDSKAFMYGRVVNKKARHNLCFANFRQSADYENKKGTVVHFEDVPNTKAIKETLARILPENENMQNLVCEGNYYYDTPNTFIGFHGDKERRIVVAARLGDDFPIYYQWYHQSKPIGKLFTYSLSHGDIYFMSDKTVGSDWMSSSKYTLRHAAALNKKLIGL